MTYPPVTENWEQACDHLAQVEPRFLPLFHRYRGQRLSGSGDPFQTLANAIIGQQISVSAAEAIWRRLGALLGEFSPERVLLQTIDTLRTAGLSLRKAEYLIGLAKAFDDRTLDPAHWPTQDDHTIQTSLTALRGIGPWTAEMFLIFHLHRPDILPLDDIGILKSSAQFFGQDGKMDRKELLAAAVPWRPYRTVASWYLWRTLDPEPVVY